MRIVFLGSGAFGLPTLSALVERHEVGLVVTQPDRPAGRRRHLTPTPIARWAEAHRVPLIRPPRINAPEVVDHIRQARADAHVVVAYGQKVGQAIIDAPRYGPVGTMNLHASLLPKYRGAAPINWAIMRGEKVTGNTVFALVEKMDAGDILAARSIPIDPMETAGELHERLSRAGPDLVLDVLQRLEAGRLEPRPQDESQATLAPKLGRNDAGIQWRWSAVEIQRHVHGLSPWPGVTVHYARPGEDQPHPLKLLRVAVAMAAEAMDASNPGDLAESGAILTGEGAVRLVEVQVPGKRPMEWWDFVHGHPLPPGTRFE